MPAPTVSPSLASLLLCLWGSTAHAQFPSIEVKVKYICRQEGRYWTAYNGGEKHYCWEGKHYSKSTGGVPQFVLDYWAERARESAQIREEMQQVRQNLAVHGAANRAGHRLGKGRVVEGAAASVEQSAKPVYAPLDLDRFDGLEAGVEREAIVARLGPPHGSISNLGSAGDEESMTYLVETGGNASLRLKQGKLVTIQLPGAGR